LADSKKKYGLGRPERSYQEKARRRRTQILKTAREVLAREGWPNFKLRTVAARCGISLGNMQYYFPTKKELLHTLIEDIHSAYDAEYEKLFRRIDGDPEARFVGVVDFLLKDLRKPLVRGFFFQFWAMAGHDRYAEEQMEFTYDYYRRVLERLIGAMNPRLSATERRGRAAAIQSLIEGSTLTLRRNGRGWRHPPGLHDLIVQRSLQLAIDASDAE